MARAKMHITGTAGALLTCTFNSIDYIKELDSISAPYENIGQFMQCIRERGLRC